MTFKLVNQREGSVYVNESLTLQRNGSVTVTHIDALTLAAILRGDIASTPAVTAILVTGDLANGAAILTNTTGTPVAPTNGAITLAAITDTATAANAIATIAAELNKTNAVVTSLVNRVEMLQKKAGL